MTQEAFLKAQASGAEEMAPYEYYGAQARIEEAKIKAAHAKYGSAIKSMKEAAQLSQAALAISTKQSQGPTK